MKNTTFKRRALLSSVAMLLVALVALGSATFAWFVSDPTAKADGLAMKTTTSTGLVIDTQYDGNETFTHDEDFNVQTTNGGTSGYASTVTMSPVTMTQTGALKTVEADRSTNYIGKEDATVSTADTSTYYVEEVYAKTTDGAASTITKATVTFTPATNAPAIAAAFRVALVSGTTVVGTWAPSGNNSGGRYLADAVTAYPASAPTTTRTITATGTQLTGLNIAIAANSTTTLKLIAYLDGEDEACYSDQASLADCFSNITLNLSL